MPWFFDIFPRLSTLAIALAFTALWVWLWYRGTVKRRRAMTIRDRTGVQLPKAKGSFARYVSADGMTDRVLSGGMDQVAPKSLSVHILKPTAGLRYFSILATAVIVPATLLAPPDMLPIGLELRLGLIALVLYTFLYVQTYVLRYDDHEITAPNFFFARVTMRWRDVMAVEDAGQNDIIVRTETGKKLRVLKHLVGMTDFVTYARQRILQNDSELCPSFQKSRPFGVG